MREAREVAVIVTMGLLIAGLHAGCGKTSPSPGTAVRSPELRRLRGQIFIVTNARANVRLGMVTVSAVREAEVRAYLDAKAKDAAEQTTRLEVALASAERAVAVSQVAVRAAKKADEREWRQFLEHPSMPYNSAEYQRAIRAAEKHRDENAVAVARVQRQLSLLGTSEYLCSSIPAGAASAKSDADGRFTLDVPAGEEIVLAAQASRQVFGTSETYCWLVKPTGEETLLSNDNQVTSGEAQFGLGYLKLKPQK